MTHKKYNPKLAILSIISTTLISYLPPALGMENNQLGQSNDNSSSSNAQTNSLEEENVAVYTNRNLDDANNLPAHNAEPNIIGNIPSSITAERIIIHASGDVINDGILNSKEISITILPVNSIDINRN